VIFPVNLISLELAPTDTTNSPVGTTHVCLAESQYDRSLRLNLNVAVPLFPASKFCFVKPLSCLGAAVGALAGKLIYSCDTSAPVTPPLFVIFAVTVATVSKRSMEPPTPFVVEAGPAVGFPSTVMSEYVKFV